METYASGLTEAQVEAAVNWWKEAVRRPRYDNGDTSEIGGITMMMAMMAAPDVVPDAVDEFGKNLSEVLQSDARVANSGLHVDYNPNRTLFDCADAAGLPIGENIGFPWKTHMWFRNGGVQVACGYGAASKSVLVAVRETSDQN